MQTPRSDAPLNDSGTIMFGPSPSELSDAYSEWKGYHYLNKEPTEVALFVCAFSLQRIAEFLDKLRIPTWLLSGK
jgi:hypothetical protein